MLKKTVYITMLAGILFTGPLMAQDQDSATAGESGASSAAQGSDSAPKVDTDVKELSGISIIGNEEAPKSLYIVPWQNSEVGVATSLQSGLFDESMRPVQMEVFRRELNYYELSQQR